MLKTNYNNIFIGWLCSTEVECWSLTSELSLSCTWPTANGWPLMWVNHMLQ